MLDRSPRESDTPHAALTRAHNSPLILFLVVTLAAALSSTSRGASSKSVDRDTRPSFLIPDDPWFALSTPRIASTRSENNVPTDRAAAIATNRSLGTALHWECSNQEAFDRAKSEGKLVFLIEVSGNFEIPGFT